MLANPGAQSQSGSSRLSGLWRKAGCVVAAGAGGWLMSLTFRAAIPEGSWLRAENAFLEGRLADARIACISGLAAQPHSRLERLLGDIYLDIARAQKTSLERTKWARLAVVHLERNLDISPFDAICYLQLAQAQAILGGREAALNSAVAAIGRTPTQGRGYEVYGELLEDQGRLLEALEAYKIASRLPGNVRAHRRGEELQKKLLILNQ
jgi:tetratricopeptide (TPR) repeat protein